VNPFIQIVIVTVVAFVGLSGITLLLQKQRAGRGKAHPPDRLTKLPTIDAFRSQVRHAFAEAAKTKGHLSLIIVDLDHLTRFNELYGRQVGDELIVQCAATLRKTVRKSDPFGRTAGQQFAVIVPTSSEKSKEIAERLLVALRKTSHSVGTHMLKITASAGVATVPTHTRSVEGLFQAAIEALKDAKFSGRNRVVLFNPEKHTLPTGQDQADADRL
jgi:diguanylate cyclase (GGDEF)-like protein